MYGSAYGGNWNSFVLSLTIPIATFFAVRYFVPLYRSVGSVSAYHFLEQRFGSWAKLYASTFYLLTQFARTGAVLYLTALPVGVVFGWDVQQLALIIGLSTVVFSVVGGTWSGILPPRPSGWCSCTDFSSIYRISVSIKISFSGTLPPKPRRKPKRLLFWGPCSILFLLAIVSRKIQSRAAIVGVIVGVCVIAWVSLSKIIFTSKALRSPFHDNMAIVLGTLAIFFTGFLINFFLRSPKTEQ